MQVKYFVNNRRYLGLDIINNNFKANVNKVYKSQLSL